MSDLDFDELDKAVNSLVGSKDTPQAPKDSEEKPAQTPAADPEPVQKPSEQPSSNLPSKRSGRFMDMKHTSSDMGSKDALTSRVGTNISPINSDEIKADLKKPDENNQDTSTTKDPNSLQSAPNNSVENTPSEVSEETSSGLDFEETDPKKDESDDKKESPFIDDAKVEKRPLGGFSTEAAPEEDDKDTSSDKKSTEEEVTTPPPAPVELPPELDKDLVAIEAGESPDSIKVAEPEKDAEEKEPKEEDKKNEKEEGKDKKEDEDKSDETPKSPEAKEEKQQQDHKEKIAELLASASSGSIPDQYKREKRSHELQKADAHPLFDAEHFKNDPQAAHKKPKSAGKKIFQWVFISVGLLLLGASLGTAVFVFVSQM